MLKSIIVAIVSLFVFSGCTGFITGHEYSKKDFEIMYKVTKLGATQFMTREQIEQARLDKVNIVVTDTYKLIEGKNVP